MNIFTDINVAAVKAEFERFSSMDKGLIDLIPAAVEAVKQETMKKMKLFSSDGKANLRPDSIPALNASSLDKEELVRAVTAEVIRHLKNR